MILNDGDRTNMIESMKFNVVFFSVRMEYSHD